MLKCIYLGPTPEMLTQSLELGPTTWHFLYTHPEELCRRGQWIPWEYDPQAQVPTGLMLLASPIPNHFVLLACSELRPCFTFVYLWTQCSGFALSWSTMVNPRMLPNSSLVLILSCRSWFTAHFLAQSCLPEIWLRLSSTFHPKFFRGDASTLVASIHLL